MAEYAAGNEVLNGWRIVQALGEGGFGKVFEVEKPIHGISARSALKVVSIPPSPAAVVMLRAEGVDDDSIAAYLGKEVDDFCAEVALLSALSHPHVVAYQDHDVLPHEDGFGADILLRMELLRPLSSLMASGGLQRADALRCVAQVADALAFCHERGIVHRDVKPDNVFVDAVGTYKLGDFGISRAFESTRTMLSQKGTPDFMAPELVRGEPSGPKVDVYSLGIMLYRLLNGGRSPFLPPAPQPFSYADRVAAISRRLKGEAVPPIPGLDDETFAVVAAACAFEADERPSARRLRAQLRELVRRSEPSNAPAVPRAQSTSASVEAAGQAAPTPAAPAKTQLETQPEPSAAGRDSEDETPQRDVEAAPAMAGAQQEAPAPQPQLPLTDSGTIDAMAAFGKAGADAQRPHRVRDAEPARARAKDAPAHGKGTAGQKAGRIDFGIRPAQGQKPVPDPSAHPRDRERAPQKMSGGRVIDLGAGTGPSADRPPIVADPWADRPPIVADPWADSADAARLRDLGLGAAGWPPLVIKSQKAARAQSDAEDMASYAQRLCSEFQKNHSDKADFSVTDRQRAQLDATDIPDLFLACDPYGHGGHAFGVCARGLLFRKGRKANVTLYDWESLAKHDLPPVYTDEATIVLRKTYDAKSSYRGETVAAWKNDVLRYHLWGLYCGLYWHARRLYYEPFQYKLKLAKQGLDTFVEFETGTLRKIVPALDPSRASAKLLSRLEVGADERVLIAHDDGTWSKGKYGFVITDAGFRCRRSFSDHTYVTSWADLAGHTFAPAVLPGSPNEVTLVGKYDRPLANYSGYSSKKAYDLARIQLFACELHAGVRAALL